jgi:hypothetical protein
VYHKNKEIIIDDYGDNSREIYEPGSPSSSIQGNRRHSHSMFVPIPSFVVSDWQKGLEGDVTLENSLETTHKPFILDLNSVRLLPRR